ncbi:MAG: hypothetical protein Q4F06_03050 [Eubacteriales bacterium]|nr:hypothetical protein [Eubacteriales bacterium]
MKKRKTLVNVASYVVIICLAIFYMGVLVLGQKRDVSEEYRLFYLDNELSMWPGEEGLDYIMGTSEVYDFYTLEEYKKFLEEEKLYGNISGDKDSSENQEDDGDSQGIPGGEHKVESNRESALEKFFVKMAYTDNKSGIDTVDISDDDENGDKRSDDTGATSKNKNSLTIPYRYTKGFISLHSGLYTNNSNEASLYYRFKKGINKDIMVELYGASYNTATNVYVNDELVGTIEAYGDVSNAVFYYKDEYGDKQRVDRVNENKNLIKIPASLIPEDGLVKITFKPEEASDVYKYSTDISEDDFTKYKGFRITAINMSY